MQSDFESAAWAGNHKLISDMMACWIDKAAYAFRRLQAIEYDAPWERKITPPQFCHNSGEIVS